MSIAATTPIIEQSTVTLKATISELSRIPWSLPQMYMVPRRTSKNMPPRGESEMNSGLVRMSMNQWNENLP